MSMIDEIFTHLPRQGPGDEASTKRALELIGPLPRDAKILDIGCGGGAQTLVLAEETQAHITAVDTFTPLLDVLRARLVKRGLQARVTIACEPMESLDFPDETFDCIWSEGAIYNMGFMRGLCEWRHFLKPHGTIAVTEATWLKKNPPLEAQEFWDEAYPQMGSLAENLEVIRECGYSEIGHFVLPESAWWQLYYDPMAKRIAELRETTSNTEDRLFLDALTHEMHLYRLYSQYYGYVFYVARKKS